MEFLKYLPKNILSQVVGDLVSIEQPEVVAKAARDWFIKKYNIDMSEAELPLDKYTSIAKLFTRKLKPGIRPIGDGIVHPCDAELTTAEKINGQSLIQAKGRTYNLDQLLGEDGLGQEFHGGHHLVYYLCPTDYHRVHSPVDGFIKKVVHVPGELWPVNQWSVQNIESLFAVNERVIMHYETDLGPVALIMVGATNVGKISVSFDRGIITNQKIQTRDIKIKNYSSHIPIKRGDEVGIFHMGSTVVMLYGPNMIEQTPPLKKVKIGQSLRS